MPIEIRITKRVDPDWKYQRLFDQEIITIGRESDNTIFLEDERQLVSRKHAEIRRVKSGFVIEDLGGRNGTHLNDERLQPKVAQLLNERDQVRLGDYLIDFQFIKQRIPSDETKSFELFFEKETRSLSRALSKLISSYSKSKIVVKDKLLWEALEKNLGSGNFQFFKNLFDSATPSIKSGDSHSSSLQLESVNVNERLRSVIEILAETTVAVASHAAHVKFEVFGDTRIQNSELPFLDSMSAQGLVDYLLDSSLSDKEYERRLSLIKVQIGEAQQHPHGLLEGHSAAILVGLKEYFDSVKPGLNYQKLEAELGQEVLALGFIKIPMRFVPIWPKYSMYVKLKSNVQKFLEEKVEHIEKRYIRQNYKRAYNKWMNSSESYTGQDNSNES